MCIRDSANGIVQALALVAKTAPIVVRLDGTNAPEGRDILQRHASATLQMMPDMLTAAKSAVAIAAQ